MNHVEFGREILRYTNKSVVGSLETSSTVHLFHTENLSLYLADLFTKVKDKKHPSKELYKDRNKLKLVILETCPGSGGDEKWDLYYWYEYYKSKGYKFYSDYRPVVVIPMITVQPSRVLVQLRNKAYNRFTIGVFETVQEAEEFIKDYYSGDWVIPVWAANKLTIDYFSGNVSK